MQNKLQYVFQYFLPKDFYPHSIVHSIANLFSLGITGLSLQGLPSHPISIQMLSQSMFPIPRFQVLFQFRL